MVRGVFVKFHTGLYSYEFHKSLLNCFITDEYKYDDMAMFILYVVTFLEHKKM
jgi:hypothetical protein